MNDTEIVKFLQANINVLQRLDEKLHTLIGITNKIDRSIGVDDNIPLAELKGREGFSLTSADANTFIQVLVGGQTIMGVAREQILRHERIVIGGGDVANPDIYPIPFIIRGVSGDSTVYNITNVTPSGNIGGATSSAGGSTSSASVSSGGASFETRVITVGLDKGSVVCNGTWDISIEGFDDSTLDIINLPETITNRTTGDIYSTTGATISAGNNISLSADANIDAIQPVATDVITIPLLFSMNDLLKQFPPTIAEMSLAAGATYTASYAANKKLLYISVDLPQGVECTITNGGVTWLLDTDSIGALEFINGILFTTFAISVTNTTAIAQNWSVKVIFEAYA